MDWEIEFTDEFGKWWDDLTEDEQESVASSVIVLRQLGPALGFPHSSGIAGSKHSHMRELRIQHRGKPYRVLYCFDPRRVAVLLIGGNKTGDNRWYQTYLPVADRIYDQHLRELKAEDEKKAGDEKTKTKEEKKDEL
ncbi:MAG TPA: type II toxin-antitoxin system RelE/ParE family toxin [Candidatus Angelobacter sp.]|jgi:hypothetical protein|nr:type II toxin-antitoxin system RelE/ParE family toxin [Candidatus Angelobacter sp.]